MRKIPFVLVLACITASVLAQFPAFGKIEYKSMPSKILNEDREYAVYLPKNYEQNTDKHYPVLYLLHGGGGAHTDWAQQGALQGVANQLIDANDACEMIIVCPEAGKTFMNYFNSPEWRYEDYFFEELIPFIDTNYRTRADKYHRAIAGLSMGGGGTIAYAIRHPEMFCAAYAMSGYFNSIDLFWINRNDPVQDKIHRLVEENNCIELVNKLSGKTLDDVKTIRWFIDCGDDDFCYDLNIDFVAALRKQQIPYQLRIRDGGHTWAYWHSCLYIALPWITRAFD